MIKEDGNGFFERRMKAQLLTELSGPWLTFQQRTQYLRVVNNG